VTLGYLYLLQNPLYGAYVIKIGLTTREPDVRARELYVGSSGVPVPFEIATAYSVGDCKLAEKQTHKRLAAYRLNRGREFFRTSPAVAAAIAYDTCTKINDHLGLPPPEVFEIDKTPPHLPTGLRDKNAKSVAEAFDGITELVDPFTLRDSPLGTSTLTPEQLDRVEILKMHLSRLYPGKMEEILSSFSRDTTPEKEIKIWECITKAYLTIEQVEFASDDLRHEAFVLLLARSWSSTNEVLSSYELKHFSPKSAKRLLQAYELRPMPIVVRSRREYKLQQAD
jgi:hypothetical protein